MLRSLRYGLVALAVLALPHLAAADAFERARRAVPVNIGQADLSGFSLRGGAALNSGAPPAGSSLLQGQASIGAPCGAFNFVTSMTQAFEEIPELFEGMLESIIANMPMLVLCYTSPSLCDLGKHFQGLINMLIQAKYAQCNQVQVAMAYSGMRLRQGVLGECLEAAANDGVPLNQAMQQCSQTVSSLRLPDGLRGGQLNLVQDTMTAAGATPEMKTLAGALLGEVTMRTGNGALGVSQTRPQGAMMARFEAHRVATVTTLHTAVDELRATGGVAPATLEALAVPGQAVPRVVLESLAGLRHDSGRYQSHATKIAANLAYTRLTWECAELDEQLAGAIDGNQHLGEEQRHLMTQRRAEIARELEYVGRKKGVVEQHLQPAYEAVVREYEGIQSVATQHGLRAPHQKPLPLPYGRQNSIGYSQ